MEEERFGQTVQGLRWNNVLLPLHLQTSGRLFWKSVNTCILFESLPSVQVVYRALWDMACTMHYLISFTSRPPYGARGQILSPWLHGGSSRFWHRVSGTTTLCKSRLYPLVRVSEFNLWSELGTGWPSWPVILYCRSTTYTPYITSDTLHIENILSK